MYNGVDGPRKPLHVVGWKYSECAICDSRTTHLGATPSDVEVGGDDGVEVGIEPNHRLDCAFDLQDSWLAGVVVLGAGSDGVDGTDGGRDGEMTLDGEMVG